MWSLEVLVRLNAGLVSARITRRSPGLERLFLRGFRPVARCSWSGRSNSGPRPDATDGCADLRASLLGVARQVQIVAAEHVFTRVAVRARLVAAVLKRAAGLVAAVEVPQISVDAAAVFVVGAKVRPLVSAAHLVSLRMV
ncbi:hypothetical protein [Burkholderia ubonensis]|uniref:hypothetical protein n=1 Tax=Burkholderia ubonensis TaxID=101571 RepID=UPI0015A5A6E1|nr:hypothetical protein [Burkholderia ubonensis]